MISSFAVYLFQVSLLFASGGWASEQSFLARRWPRRFLWLTVLAVSVVFPLAMALEVSPAPRTPPRPPDPQTFYPVRIPPVVQVQEPAPTSGRPAATPAVVAVAQVRPPDARRPARPSFDLVVSILWLSSSLATAMWYLLAGVRLRRLVRRAPSATVQGVAVRLTPAGPAVFGVFRPAILWPDWLGEAPAATQAAAIAHEQQHLAAGDPLMLAAGLFLVVLAPWNPVQWWQLQRMRFALEADCDQRVVQGGTQTQAYALALLQIAERRPAWDTRLAMPMSAPSWLERRVGTLLYAPGRMRTWTALAVPLALAALAVAGELPAPRLHGAELRMLPPEDTRPGADWARAIARSRYPELFDRHFEGTAVVAAIFNPDGTPRLADEHLFAPGVPPSDLKLEVENQRAGIDPNNDISYACHEGRSIGGGEYCTIGPWLDTVNAARVFVVYEVLAWEPDPLRSAARVEAALRASAPELFPNADPESHTSLFEVTLFMNDDGRVAQLSKFAMQMGKSYAVQYPVERFAAMGVPRERLGRGGWFMAGTTKVLYAWPKRPDDPPNMWGSAIPDDVHPDPTPNAHPRYDSEDEERIAERLLQDTQPQEVRVPLLGSPGAVGVIERLPWVLLGRDGRVWASGIGTGLPEEIEDRYPGVRVDRAGGFNRVRVATAWISPDSPIQLKSDVDLQRRKQFLVTGQGMWPEVSMTGLAPLQA